MSGSGGVLPGHARLSGGWPEMLASEGPELQVDRIACDGHGLCGELLPEFIALDDWGYPIIRPGPLPAHLLGHARRAVEVCPVLALRLRVPASPERAR